MDFDNAIGFVLAREGQFQDQRGDPGNWTGGAIGKGELKGTNFGISAAAYPTLDIRTLTVDEAKAIYRRDYWTPIRGDDLPAGVDLFALDGAVNQGLVTIRDLQMAARVAVDGKIGPQTLAMARGTAFLARYAARRAVRYSQARAFTIYAEGWFTRLFQAHATALAAMQPDQSGPSGSP